MSGALVVTLGNSAAGGGGGGGGGGGDVPAALTWQDIFASGGSGFTDTLTVTGISVPISISATKTGLAALYYVLNGNPVAYSGQFLVHVGDTLAWGATTAARGEKAGTITVVNVTDSNTTLDVINYDIGSGNL